LSQSEQAAHPRAQRIVDRDAPNFAIGSLAEIGASPRVDDGESVAGRRAGSRRDEHASIAATLVQDTLQQRREDDIRARIRGAAQFVHGCAAHSRNAAAELRDGRFERRASGHRITGSACGVDPRRCPETGEQQGDQ